MRTSTDMTTPKYSAFVLAHPDWIPSYSSGVPSGWDAIVADALVALHALAVETGVSIRPAQIKEKFGQLRLYLEVDEASAGPLRIVQNAPGHMRMQSAAAHGSVRERADAIVITAEERASQVCVLCGAPTSDTRRVYRMCNVHPDDPS